MGIMGFLRNRAGAIIVIAIGLAIVAFLLSDVAKSGKGFIADAQSEVGKVAGEAISYKDFNDKLEQNSQQFKAQMGTLNARMQSYVVENTWNQMMSKIILDKQINKVGLSVGETELFDLMFNNPSQQIAQIFTDPKTGKFNREMALSSRKAAEKQEDGKLLEQWNLLEKSIYDERISQKYQALIANGVYANSLDAKDEFINRNKLVNFDYVAQNISTIPDAEVKPTDEDYKAYYDEFKYKFENLNETRSFDYVVFDASPSKEDSVEARAKINKIADGFRSAENDSLYYAINSDSKSPFKYSKKGELEPALDSVMFNATKGYVYGPYNTNGAFKVSKLLAIKVGPDSVKARHILISAASAGGEDKAISKADSIKKLIEAGADFKKLAAQYSEDGSRDAGGDLGTFARGAMVPAFEDAVFDGTSGKLYVVKTQFGVHVIEVQKQIGSSKVVKVATIDKAIAPSAKTEQQAYQKAQSFLSEVNSVETFNKVAQQQKLEKLSAQDLTPLQASFGTLEEGRPVVKWAFKADKGEVANEIFNVGDQYVVAVLTSVKPKGVLSLEDVKVQIEPAVKNRVKVNLAASKLEAALNGATSISQVASKLKTAITPIQNVVLANPVLPGIGQENALVGSVFGSKIQKLSKVIKGEAGAYVYVVKGFINPKVPSVLTSNKDALAKTFSSAQQNVLFKALQKSVKIEDNRNKFY